MLYIASTKAFKNCVCGRSLEGTHTIVLLVVLAMCFMCSRGLRRPSQRDQPPLPFNSGHRAPGDGRRAAGRMPP
jgi:hypothetical protein